MVSVGDVAVVDGLLVSGLSTKMIEQGWAADFPAFGGREGASLPDDDFERLVERASQLLKNEEQH